jgi:hypothetical protein
MEEAAAANEAADEDDVSLWNDSEDCESGGSRGRKTSSAITVAPGSPSQWASAERHSSPPHAVRADPTCASATLATKQSTVASAVNSVEHRRSYRNQVASYQREEARQTSPSYDPHTATATLPLPFSEDESADEMVPRRSSTSWPSLQHSNPPTGPKSRGCWA